MKSNDSRFLSIIELLKVVESHAPQQARTLLTTIDPDSALAAASDELLDRFADLPLARVADVPEVGLLRACARTLRFGDAGELGSHLYQCMVQLLERASVPHADPAAMRWAELAGAYWAQWALYLDEATAAAGRIRQLRTRFPHHRELPRLAAGWAAVCSAAGERADAAELWKLALEHPANADRADDWWAIRLEHAKFWLLGGAAQPEAALVDFQRARAHFAGRTERHFASSYCDACANLVHTLMLLGRFSQARVELEDSIAGAAPGSVIESYLAGMRPLISAMSGRLTEARALLDDVPDNVAAMPSYAALVSGPTQLLIAGAAGDSPLLLRTLVALREAESAERGMPVHRIEWRLHAARAARACGLADVERELADELRALADQTTSPSYVLLSRCARIELSTIDDGERSRAALEIISQVQSLQLERLAGAGLGAPGGAIAAQVVLDERCDGDLAACAKNVLAFADESPFGVLAGAADTPSRAVDRRPAGAVTIRLLGEFSVMIDGIAIPGSAWQGRRQARLLMAWLLLAPNAARDRDEVADLLWPDIAPRAVGARLSPLVHTIRQLLNMGTARAEGAPNPRLLEADRTSLRLQLAAGDRCDVHDLLKLVERFHAAADNVELVDLGFAALATYRGSLMAGQGFDEVLMAAREHLLNTVMTVVDRLAVVVNDSQTDTLRLIAWLRGVNEAEPLRPDVARSLAAMLAASGSHELADRVLERSVESFT